ncbi:isoaspartyl peptidase/L-asparaginase isoform X1 [Lampetra planeri]
MGQSGVDPAEAAGPQILEEEVTPCEWLAEVPFVEEILKAIQRLRTGKAPGRDDLPSEMLREGGVCAQTALHDIIITVWTTGRVPQDWKDALVVPLFKKADCTDCNNYRGSSLLSVPENVLASIIQHRLARHVEERLAEPQCGFRKGRSCTDAIFSFRLLHQRCREFQQDLHLCFIDLVKVYDTISRPGLWVVLHAFGVPDPLHTIIKDLHDGSGGYADNQLGAVSTTGDGESIMRVVLARLVLFNVQQGMSLEEAADSALSHMTARVGGTAGLVLLAPDGRWAARFNSLRMSWAAASPGAALLHYGLERGEILAEPAPPMPLTAPGPGSGAGPKR